MATAVEKIDKIENIHDGTSTKLSDQTASESTMENGELCPDDPGMQAKKEVFNAQCS
jgi:hypothetical protein